MDDQQPKTLHEKIRELRGELSRLRWIICALSFAPLGLFLCAIFSGSDSKAFPLAALLGCCLSFYLTIKSFKIARAIPKSGTSYVFTPASADASPIPLCTLPSDY